MKCTTKIQNSVTSAKIFFYLTFFVILIFSCKSNQQIKEKEQIVVVNQTLDAWHKAAAESKFEQYFSLMTPDGVFVGTDPTENWQNAAFRTFSKPYFDKGKSWNFSSIQRNVYFNDDYTIAWFDELLATQMKICRGSGVLKKQNGMWKIAHYVLSIAIPNENTNEVVKIKSNFDNQLIEKIKK